MTTPRALTGILSVVVFLTLVSSARADAVHVDIGLEKLIFAQTHNLVDSNIESVDSGYVYTGHFENNNGKHLGFSMTSVNRGPRLGIVRQEAAGVSVLQNGSVLQSVSTLPNVSVSQNPEPATMVLLGTGLAAVGAFARKKGRKRLL